MASISTVDVTVRPSIGGFMYLGYFDESDRAEEGKYTVVAGIALHDKKDFDALEQILAALIEVYVPSELWDDFEFHTANLWHSRKPFDKVPQETAQRIVVECVEAIEALGAPIFYGAVDSEKLRKTVYGNVQPVTVCFRVCMIGFEQWLKKEHDNEMGLIVFDNRGPNEKDAVRHQINQAFRSYRTRATSFAWTHENRGLLQHIHDDLYFGNSAFSYGIQAADVCAYFIRRHLDGFEDTEYLYKKLEPLIAYKEVLP